MPLKPGLTPTDSQEHRFLVRSALRPVGPILEMSTRVALRRGARGRGVAGEGGRGVKAGGGGEKRGEGGEGEGEAGKGRGGTEGVEGKGREEEGNSVKLKGPCICRDPRVSFS